MFRVAGREYEVTHAALELFDRNDEDTICWGLKILGKGRGGSDDMSRWKPAVLSDVLMETLPGRVSHWYEIAGTTVAWDEPNEDPQALFGVYETTAIYNCKWRFLPAPDNTRVRLVFDGMTDIDADYANVPIHVDTLLGIAPWPMESMSQQAALARYHQLGFKDPVEFRVVDGLSSLVFPDQ